MESARGAPVGLSQLTVGMSYAIVVAHLTAAKQRDSNVTWIYHTAQSTVVFAGGRPHEDCR